MPRVVFLRLRNRTLNRFKDAKKTKAIEAKTEPIILKTKAISKNKSATKLGFVTAGKTLRVVPRLNRTRNDHKNGK